MPEFNITIKAHTDPVPGAYHTPEDIVERMKTDSMTYVDSVELEFAPPYKLGDEAVGYPFTMPTMVVSMACHEVNELGDHSWFVLCAGYDKAPPFDRRWYIEKWDARYDPNDYLHKSTPVEEDEKFTMFRQVIDMGHNLPLATSVLRDPLRALSFCRKR